MLNWWGDVTIVGGLSPLIVADIPVNLKPVDAAYFRTSREARLHLANALILLRTRS